MFDMVFPIEMSITNSMKKIFFNQIYSCTVLFPTQSNIFKSNVHFFSIKNFRIFISEIVKIWINRGRKREGERDYIEIQMAGVHLLI